ncbi:MAG TPA: AlkA N-terminal domain-containing protein, partial [Acidimicrobiales bacterium]|nr:AlkA N-terminal domain-containing protein [Acidimicrobiales bacterium]
DREGVPSLARRLGYSTRQLERLLRAELGAGPLALARAQRAQTARVLAETTALPFAEVAFAAGFSSVRQFNETVRDVFAATPRELRAAAARREAPARAGALVLRLPFRRPFAPAGLFGHLSATAVPGVEEVRAAAYRRTLRLAHGAGVVALAPRADHVSCRIHLDDGRDLAAAIARCRRLLDLDADPEAVDTALGGDARLAASVAANPGRRLPRCVDEHEMALRVVLGQNVTTAAARSLGARVVALAGTTTRDPDGGLTALFPTATEVASLSPRSLPMPAGRGRALVGLAAALAGGEIELGPGADWDRAREQLVRLPGIGPWTAEMVALRALGDPDAFPSTDAGVLAGARELGLPGDARQLTADARRWRPWRGYAVQHLWGARPTVDRWPAEEKRR